MKLKFFTIPIAAPEATEADLNRFLASHRISRVEKVFVPDGAASAFSVLVTWMDDRHQPPIGATVQGEPGA